MKLTPQVTECADDADMNNEFGRVWSLRSPAFESGPFGFKTVHLGLIGERLGWSAPMVETRTFTWEAWHDCRDMPGEGIEAECHGSGEAATFEEALAAVEAVWMCSWMTPPEPVPYTGAGFIKSLSSMLP